MAFHTAGSSSSSSSSERLGLHVLRTGVAHATQQKTRGSISACPDMQLSHAHVLQDLEPSPGAAR
jgi:hypothetical protein